MNLQLRIHAVTHAPQLVGAEADEADGQRLVQLVRTGLERGGIPPVAVILRAERLEIVELRAVLQAKINIARFLATLTRSWEESGGEARAVGLMGRFDYHPNGNRGTPGVPIAQVFLEWPDCRWWQWRGLLDPEAKTIEKPTETVLAATRGDSMPRGMGRWWSAGRRFPEQFVLRRREPNPPANELIH